MMNIEHYCVRKQQQKIYEKGVYKDLHITYIKLVYLVNKNNFY